jgi:segregation and condensation protein B
MRMTADLKAALEAILLVAEEPVPAHLLAQLLEVPATTVDALCDEMAAAYEAEGRGFQLAKVAGGYRYHSHPDQAAYVERVVLEGQTTRLSAAALETLAIIAYKQPIMRAAVETIRGVSSGEVIRSLMDRHLIKIVGRAEEVGRPMLYGTTKTFLELFGLNSLKDLPNAKELQKP